VRRGTTLTGEKFQKAAKALVKRGTHE
jgi:hypothetical protein